MTISDLLFVLFVAAGAYVQAVAGFAMAMIVVAMASAAALFPLPVITAAVTVCALVNVLGALHGHYRSVHWPGWRMMALAVVPGTSIGVLGLYRLDDQAAHLLQLLLGTFLLGGAMAMMLRPNPAASVASAPTFLLAGFGSGLLNGMFGAGGPVAGWFMYRQPLTVMNIRATLLAFFLVSSVWRLAAVTVAGGLTQEVWRLCALSVPVVLLFTYLGRRYPPLLEEQQMRRAAFVLLMVCGVLVLAQGVLSLAKAS